jgi:hypothetical protein
MASSPILPKMQLYFFTLIHEDNLAPATWPKPKQRMCVVNVALTTANGRAIAPTAVLGIPFKRFV